MCSWKVFGYAAAVTVNVANGTRTISISAREGKYILLDVILTPFFLCGLRKVEESAQAGRFLLQYCSLARYPSTHVVIHIRRCVRRVEAHIYMLNAHTHSIHMHKRARFIHRPLFNHSHAQFTDILFLLFHYYTNK